MADAVAQLSDLEGKRCIAGLSYFDPAGDLLSQRTLAATVVSASDAGIVLRPLQNDRDFTLPPELSPWFIAPPGRYQDSDNVQLDNPDFLVTWNVHRKKSTHQSGQHEWWDWVPCTTPPTVG